MIIAKATRWNSAKKEAEKVVIGVFEKYNVAEIFKKAYEREMKTDVELICN